MEGERALTVWRNEKSPPVVEGFESKWVVRLEE